MGDNAIEASYLWTVEEFVEISRLVNPARLSPIARYGFAFLSLASGFFGLISLFQPWPSPMIACLFLTMAILALLAVVLNRDSGYRRAFRRSGDLAEPDSKITIVADEDRIRKISPGTDANYAWNLVTKVLQAPNGFAIFLGIQVIWLPSHAFRDEFDREAFADLARRRALSFIRSGFAG